MLIELSDSLILKIKEAVASRDVEEALKILKKLSSALTTPLLPHHNAYALLAYQAWAIDFDQSFRFEVERIWPHFCAIPASATPLSDLAYLHIAGGLINLHREEYDIAIGHFKKALKYAIDAEEDELQFKKALKYTVNAEADELQTVSQYYLGRCHWKKLDYEQALAEIRNAKRRDMAAKHFKRVAAIELVEAWLLFETGKLEDAKLILAHARTILEGTNLYIDYANTISFEGRLARKSGDLKKALRCFKKAITFYQKGDLSHRNVARSFVNIAFLYRCRARDYSNILHPANRGQLRQKVERLRQRAFWYLEKAREIYLMNGQTPGRGLGKIHTISALLYFDADRLTLAEAEAEQAYEIGDRLDDNLIRADARIIQSTIALEGEDVEKAYEYANDAIHYSHKTENRRLKARAHIRIGFALSEEAFKDYEGARRAHKTAIGYLDREDNDYLRQTLNRLERQIIARSGSEKVIGVLESDIKGLTWRRVSRLLREELARHVYDQSGGIIAKVAAEWHADRRIFEDALATFKVTRYTLTVLTRQEISQVILEKLASLLDQEIVGKTKFLVAVEKTLGYELDDERAALIIRFAEVS